MTLLLDIAVAVGAVLFWMAVVVATWLLDEYEERRDRPRHAASQGDGS